MYGSYLEQHGFIQQVRNAVSTSPNTSPGSRYLACAGSSRILLGWPASRAVCCTARVLEKERKSFKHQGVSYHTHLERRTLELDPQPGRGLGPANLTTQTAREMKARHGGWGRGSADFAVDKKIAPHLCNCSRILRSFACDPHASLHTHVPKQNLRSMWQAL